MASVSLLAVLFIIKVFTYSTHMNHHPKKMNSDICSVHHPFDELPEDLKIEILRRLPTNSVAGFACVSKSWLRLITTYCFPKITTPSRLTFVGFFNVEHTEQTPSHLIYCLPHMMAFLPLPERGFFDALQLRINHQISCLDCCNGLLLFCHPINTYAAAAKLERLYSYCVINFFTYQRASIRKPVKSAFPMDAALAYDPSKSSFYRVVEFDQGARCLNVFNSETRRWKKLQFLLESYVTEAEWIQKQSVFFQGAIYKLSTSGHLLRFVVDQEVSLKDQAQAINLPDVAKKPCPKGYRLGLSNGQIHFMVFDAEFHLCIWVLSTDTYEWSLRCRLSSSQERYDFKNSFCWPLGFHPYYDIVYVGSNSQGLKSSTVMQIKFGNCVGPENHYSQQALVYKHNGITRLINWQNSITFPLSKCPVPFANGMAAHSTDGA